ERNLRAAEHDRFASLPVELADHLAEVPTRAIFEAPTHQFVEDHIAHARTVLRVWDLARDPSRREFLRVNGTLHKVACPQQADAAVATLGGNGRDLFGDVKPGHGYLGADGFQPKVN